MSLITAPNEEPVTTAEVKRWCDVVHNDDDSLFERNIKTATAHVENTTQSSLVRQQHRQYFDSFASEIDLCFGPVQSLSQIQYIDINGAIQTIADSPQPYELLIDRDKVILKPGSSWPAAQSRKNSVWIDYWAGYFNPSESPIKQTDLVPDPLKTAIKLMCRDLYDNPSQKHDVQLYNNPAFDHLIGPYLRFI